MIVMSLMSVVILALTSGSQGAAPDCHEWRECQQLALEAADRGDYEAFHDLAWRTVQTGPHKDPALLYVLARAQSLSGRPHDALIMLRRLAAMGVAPDAATNDDFRRVRALPGWPDVEAEIERVRRAAVSVPGPESHARLPRVGPGPAAEAVDSGGAPPPRAEAAEPAALKLPPIEQAVRVQARRFAPSGLAYDAVSHRFVVGDLHGRKLMVVSEGSDHVEDLVRADSAGFHEIMAIEIDGRRGDLWAATATPPESDWALHRMQLVSGRPLKTIALPSDLEPMKLVDLAVTPAGAVLALDARGSRILALRPGAATLEPVLQMKVRDATSVAATSDEKIVYVAHAAGISRVDLKTGSTVLLAASGFKLEGIDRIRRHGTRLLAVQINGDGSRRIVELKLNATGRAVTAATIIDASIPAAGGPTFATISGDELSYLVADTADLIIRRIHLR